MFGRFLDHPELKKEVKVALANQIWPSSPLLLITSALLVFLLALLCGPARAQNKPEPLVEIKVTARRFQFDPGTITVQKGRPVKLVITSEDAAHGFAIKEFGIKETIEAKQTRTIEFIPDKSGRFRIYCTVYCGEGHEDMAGELVVEEQRSASEGNIKVAFDERAPGVVFVEANGERIRIDTNTRTVAQIAERPAPPAAHTSHQPEVAKAEQPIRPAAEPYDYRLINVPTPKRVLRHSLNLYFTHRFSEPVHPLSRSGRDLIGLDSFAIASLGVFYGVTDKLYVNAYRSPVCQTGLCKTIEIGVGYHLLDEGGRSPVALSTYASIEGDDNFTEHFTYNFQAMIARSVGKYVNLFFSPALHVNANGERRFNPRAEDFFPPLPLANEFKLDQHTGSFGFGVNARIRPSVSLMFEYTPRVGFKLGQITPIFTPDFSRIIGFKNDSHAEIGFGIEKDLGRHAFSLTFSNTQTTTTSRYNSSNLTLPPSRFTIGFNLYRRFLK